MSTTRILAAAALLSCLALSAHAQSAAGPAQKGAQPGPQHEMMMGHGGMGGMPGMMGGGEGAKERGFVGIFPGLGADKVGAPAHLVVRGVAPFSPAYYAGIMRGDQITAVDGQQLDGKDMAAVVAAIRGEPGTTVKLSLSRGGQSRDVTLTRVAPIFRHGERRMGWRGHGGMERQHGHEGPQGAMGPHRQDDEPADEPSDEDGE